MIAKEKIENVIDVISCNKSINISDVRILLTLGVPIIKMLSLDLKTSTENTWALLSSKSIDYKSVLVLINKHLKKEKEIEERNSLLWMF